MITAIATKRGHPIEYNGGWVYSDSKTSIEVERSCTRCGRLPSNEGYDACTGYIEGAKSVCCGHGVEEPILMYG